MNRIKIILLGTISGLFLSIISLGMAYIAVSLLTGASIFPAALIISTLANGTVVGVAGISLSYLTSGLEHRSLILLISLAVASLTVLFGNYGNDSIMPIAIYMMALVNSMLIPRMTGSIARLKKLNEIVF